MKPIISLFFNLVEIQEHHSDVRIYSDSLNDITRKY